MGKFLETESRTHLQGPGAGREEGRDCLKDTEVPLGSVKRSGGQAVLMGTQHSECN